VLAGALAGGVLEPAAGGAGAAVEDGAAALCLGPVLVEAPPAVVLAEPGLAGAGAAVEPAAGTAL